MSSSATTSTTTSNRSSSSSSSSSQRLLLRYEDGSVQFRQRIILSILSHRPLLIRNIHADDIDSPGLRRYEVSFLRLIDRITNGSKIEINNTGTQIRFFPGIVIGGGSTTDNIQHDCPIKQQPQQDEGNEQQQDNNDIHSHDYRSIGWFLEGIIPLAPFGKYPISITFTGITDGITILDPSVDYLRSSVIPVMKLFGIGLVDTNDILSTQAPYIKIIRRGSAPLGGGCIHFYCPIIRSQLSSIDYTHFGMIKRIRGTAVSCRIISSSNTARTAHAAKGIFQRLIPDVWIHTDVHTIQKHKCGPSPNLSIHVTAESTTGVILTAESSILDHHNTNNTHRELPEDLGKRCAVSLLEQIRFGGCVDSGMQSLVLLWMCLTPEDVSRIRLGRLTQYTIESLRLYKQCLGIEFKITPDPNTKTVLLSCLGTGYRNMARPST